MSLSRALAVLGLSCGLLACQPAPTATPGSEPEAAAAAVAPVETPSLRRHAVFSTLLTLHARPEARAPSVEVLGFERAVEILDEREGWWQVRTLSPAEAVVLGLDPRAGLGVLELWGWTPAQPEREVELAPVAAADARSPIAVFTIKSAKFDFVIPAEVPLYWPDGGEAGVARETHGFHSPAVAPPEPIGTRRLMCHAERRSLTLGSIMGLLCVEFDELLEISKASSTGAGAGVDFIALDGKGRFIPEDEVADVAAIDRDVVREIVRSNIEDVRDCYNLGLTRDPTLEGRVSINFVIGPDGKVSSALVQEDNLSDEQVGQCIADKVTGWQFPEPRSGANVIITYPFNLMPD